MPKILFVFSDTGGGHRAAAEAIEAALHDQFPGRYETRLFDAFKSAVWPLSLAAPTYRPMVTYAPWFWGLGFDLTNTTPGTWLTNRVIYPFERNGIVRAMEREKPDLVVSVHPLFQNALRRVRGQCAERGHRLPLVTVVTDLFDAHRTWFTGAPDLCIVPSERACRLALGMGLAAPQVQIIGLPVSLKFATAGVETKGEVRARLGLDPDLPTVLLVGGGEGMGPLYEITRAIAALDRPLQLAVIAGRNPALQRRLERTPWRIPVQVTGFVTNMPDWMRAADLIVTKAGPGTIMEALTCELPILLSGYLPGQEEGNYKFVVESGVGALVEAPAEIAETVADWLDPNRAVLEKMRARAREVARPRAALEIAATLDGMLRGRG